MPDPGATKEARRVLIIGGSGGFGRHLVRSLAASTDLEILVGGRNLHKAEAVAAETRRRYPARRIDAVRIDRETLDGEMLRPLGVFALVDAAGPFQASGYRLPEACIAAGVHYLDLADARDFVAGFPGLDAVAKRARVTLVAGASSTPALSHAALDRLTHGWRSVDTIEIGIAPGNRAPRGLSVVSAILSYAGRPVRVFIDGRWQTRPGWGLLIRKAVPGLGRRWLSLCETPDLDLLPSRFHVRHSAIFRAGLELSLLHLGLAAAALPVRLRLISSLRRFAPMFRRIADLFSRFGSDRGGMIVETRGIDAEGRAAAAQWSLVAEAKDGPVIPTLPALALIRKLAEGGVPHGAFPGVGLLTLDEIEAEFSPYRIRACIAAEEASLFARVLPGFERMPAAVRAAHGVVGRMTLRGEGLVDGAESAIGGVLVSLFGLPKASPRVPVSVTMEKRGGREIWTRDFGGRQFRSVLGERPDGGLCERFGLLTFDLDVPTSKRGLAMAITGWRLGPIRLPGAIAPRTEAREDIDEHGRFRFDVTIGLPLIGRLVRYRGWLVP